MKDVALLDKMYELNKVYFKELSMDILAGKKKLQQVQQEELPALAAKAKASGLPEDAQAANDLAAMCNRFEKAADLELTRMVSIQMAPQIRLVQNNDTLMSEKIQSTLVNTIPLWKSQMVLAMGISTRTGRTGAARGHGHDERASAPQRPDAQDGDSRDSEGVRARRRRYRDAQVGQRVSHLHLDEVIHIQDEGRQKRREAEAELGRIENELKQKLLDVMVNRQAICEAPRGGLFRKDGRKWRKMSLLFLLRFAIIQNVQFFQHSFHYM